MTDNIGIIDRTEKDRERFSVVTEYADRVLETGRDRWSGEETPLLADGVHVETRAPVTWQYEDETWIIHNMANQQNLFRALKGLSNLTGDPAYERAAKDAIRYHFDNLVDENGLIRWGGHQFIDLQNLTPVGEFDADTHELKHNIPFYELMWDVDEEATQQYLRAIWNAHVLDWSKLDMNRHGDYNQEFESRDPWGHKFEDPDPLFEGKGLTFLNIGTDLIWAAGMLFELGDDERAWTWGRRMVEQYKKAQHPDTGLGAYQYSKPKRRKDPSEEGPLTGELTYSSYGDRAENQFGDQFGDTAKEGWALFSYAGKGLYARSSFAWLGFSEILGEKGKELLRWMADGLETYAEYAYMPDSNAFRPMWADGTDLTGETFSRTGYYGEKGTTWEPYDAGLKYLLSYIRAYRLSGRDELWETARKIGDGLGIGDIGNEPGENVSLNTDVSSADPEEIFVLLELYRVKKHRDYIERARRVADRMIEQRYHRGFFLPSKDHVHTKFDTIEPLALLALDATLRNKPEDVPAYLGGSGYIHGHYDGHGRTYASNVIWSITRDSE